MDLAQFIAKHFDRSLTSPVILSRKTASGSVIRLTPKEIGDLGERLSATWLRRKSCRILWKNYRARTGGEVDLVYRDDETLVFAEVKARTSTDFGSPADAVDAEKEGLIIRGAMDWLRRLDDPTVLYRFDILEVHLEDGKTPQIRRIENAFQLPDAYHA